MGLAEALGNMPDEPSRYRVDVVERIKALMGEEFTTIGEYDQLSYTWVGGYETLRHQMHQAGSMEYSGAYHPGDGCCKTEDGSLEGICMWCGTVI